ncbi:acyl-CoA-binding domain-containing protein 3 [Morus notabilis]|uniref:acyl-CoA-binding domain-containing protein 3 n=1 Tax=Morus notabilis TaxID=981085 RepID=UPI000CED2157|nr:acyl-CoA-binding domain-containing protein 3 [Morus notabilis]
MELVGELFLTASLAVLLSFLVAKLVAMAMAVGDSDNKPLRVSDEGVVETEVRYEESLRVRSAESERRVEFVEEAVEKVDRLGGEILEELQHSQVEGFEGQPETVGSPGERTSEGEERSLDERALDFNAKGVDEAGADDDSAEEGSENRGVEETSAKSAANDVVSLQTEEVRVVRSELEEKDEVNEVESHNIGDEDDWEGIDRNELENDFAAAVKFAEAEAKDGGRPAVLGSHVQMELFGLRKVATEGPCHEPQPPALDLSARGKWNAWQRQGKMTPEMAMEQYVTILSENVPGWMDDHFAGESREKPSEEEMAGTAAPVSGTLLHAQPNIASERESKLKFGAEKDDFTGASDLENRPTG